MKELISEDKVFLSKMLLFILSYLFMFSFLWSHDEVGKLLFIMFVIISSISIMFGILPSLIISLLFLFVIGSALLYLTLQSTNTTLLSTSFISMQNFVIYGIGLLITNLLGGTIQQQITKIILERNQLKQEVEQFVAIDPDTFFDNAKRLEMEVQTEMKRINRHNGLFSILFLELDYYKEFLKAYGHKEMEHLLRTIGEKSSNILRFSDKKFRYTDNKFAFLLIETSEDKVEIVAEKLANSLQTHTLLNGKKVTLEFHISYEEYNSEMKNIDYLDFIQSVERETVFYDL